MPYIPPYIVEQLNNLNVEDVAQALGINVKRHEAHCFKHNDRHPSLKFHRNGHLWKCFVCNIGGGPIALVMNYFNVDFPEACQWLCQQYRIYLPTQSNTFKKIRSKFKNPVTINDSTPREESHFNKEIGNWLIENTELTEDARKFLLKDRRLSPDIIENQNIKSISDSNLLIHALRSCFTDSELEEAGYIKDNDGRKYIRLFTPCLLIPYYDIDKELIGIQTRYLGDNPNAPRFQFVSGFKPTLYNLPVLTKIRGGDSLYIAEGVTDCLALLSDRLPAISIPSASSLPMSSFHDLLPYKIEMSVDRDEAGERAYGLISYNIIRLGGRIKRLDYPEQFKDYAEYFKSIN